MEQELKKLVGVTLVVVLAAALAIYALRPAVSSSGVGTPPGPDKKPACAGLGENPGTAHGHEKAASATETAKGQGPKADLESHGRGPCGEPKAEKPDQADRPASRGHAADRRDA
ncbi:MAG TPA: hypothetical protein VFA17_09690 [Thermoplasmata archaeon]|nr:hypothetical protein [Thermoplasmata archaeon]